MSGNLAGMNDGLDIDYEQVLCWNIQGTGPMSESCV